MGRRIIAQARGKGGPTYRTPPMWHPPLRYRPFGGVVMELFHHPLLSAPVMRVRYDDLADGYLLAPLGIAVGDRIERYVKTLADVPEGTTISSLETFPNSGPKLCRSPGVAATLISKGAQNAIVQLPSRREMKLNLNCRVTLGIPAGDGRGESPFAKAGTKHHLMRARGKLYPRTSAVAMNAVDHPFGGSGSGTVRPPASRDAPPGRKVGTVASRRTGRKK